MKSNFSRSKVWQSPVFSVFSLAALIFSLLFVFQTAQAQQTAQLSLADILIGLRSKKVTIAERNKLLSDAVKVRGITFVSSPEIEAELQNTGASSELIEAIKKSAAKTGATTATAAANTMAPDFAFYQKRGSERFAKGDYDAAASDFSEAIKLNPNDAAIYLNRGRINFNKKNYDAAIDDYDKAVELNPKQAMAYFNRGEALEKKGDAIKAISDFQKVVELDGGNESAKIILKRLRDEQTKIETARAEKLKAEQAKIEEANKEAKKAEQAKIEAAKTPVAPKSVEVGTLNTLAVKLIQPTYPSAAQQMNLQGKVTVQVELDEQGQVASAKAVSGHQFLRAAAEDAVRKSKFKPTIIGTQAVKTTGIIVYNFVGR